MPSEPTRLPFYMYDRRLCDLEVGDSGWLVPWALEIDAEGGMWISPSIEALAYGGTVQLKVTKREDGWHATLYSPTYSNTGPTRDRYTFRRGVRSPESCALRGLEPIVAFTDKQGQVPERGGG